MPNDVINTITIGSTTYDIGGSGSGHVIEKSDGTDMTQRANLQFVDATLTDDSTNDRTVVENVHVIDDEDELDDLPDGIYIGDYDDDTPFDASAVAYDNTDSGLTAANVQDAIDELSSEKVDVVSGKGLSSNDFDDTYKGKVDKIDTTTQSASGNPISISGLKSDQLAIDPVLTFEPIQDLHGQSKPYPAGGGKNKLPLIVDDIKAANTSGTWSGNVYTLNSVTFKINTDSANNITGITVNGTASDTTQFHLGNELTNVATGNYVLSGCPTGGSAVSTYSLRTYYNGTSSYTDDYGNGAPLNNISAFSATRIIVRSGYAASNLMFYPMIRLATESDATFAPYENICPISGYDKVEVGSCGWENILNPAKAGTITTVQGPERNGVEFKNLSGTFTFSNASGSITTYINYENNGTWAQAYITSSDTTRYKTFTVNGGVQIFVGSGNQFSSVVNPQLEYSDTPHTYSPYKPITSISESLGQTVYHATHNIRDGKMDVDSADYVFTGDETWTSAWGGIAYSCTCLTSKPAVADATQKNVYECEIAEPKTVNQIYMEQVGIAANGNNIYISSSLYASISSFTGKKLVYKLATPFTIQLTPHELTLLKTYAYLSTNGSNIQLSYHNGEMASLGDVSQLGETVNELGDELNNYKLKSIRIFHTWGSVTSGTRYTYDVTAEYPEINANTLVSISLAIPSGSLAFDHEAIMGWNYGSSEPNKVYIQYNAKTTQNNAKSYIIVLYHEM